MNDECHNQGWPGPGKGLRDPDFSQDVKAINKDPGSAMESDLHEADILGVSQPKIQNIFLIMISCGISWGRPFLATMQHM